MTRNSDLGRQKLGIPAPKQPGNGAVWTSSGLRKFWLVEVRGYVVLESHIVPKSSILGEIVFKRRWRLARFK